MGKVLTDDRNKDKRFYYDEDEPERRHPGVTSIIDVKSKPFLQTWSANMAADLALDSIDYLQRMADRDRAGAKKYVAGAARRYMYLRSDLGTKAHIHFEKRIRGQAVRRPHRDIVDHAAHFDRFLQEVQPELIRAEDVAWSDTHGYAGSFDAAARIKVDPETFRLDQQGEPLRFMLDWKTGKRTYPEVAMQLAAYRFADYVISPDGQREPMMAFDAAAVLHITDEGAELQLVRADEKAFNYFLALRTAYDWDKDAAGDRLGAFLWRSDAEGFVTGTERRG